MIPAAAAAKVLESARSGKGIPAGVTALTKEQQAKASTAAQKAAEEVIKTGGTQAAANAAGAKASNDYLATLGFRG
jgi:hypothetical protein